jgi:hypothetical protein
MAALKVSEVLRDEVVERLLSDESFVPTALFVSVPFPPGLAWLEAAVLLLPTGKGLLADAVLAAERCLGHTSLVLGEVADDLLVGEPAPTPVSS